jgi:hypothetical protein
VRLSNKFAALSAFTLLVSINEVKRLNSSEYATLSSSTSSVLPSRRQPACRSPYLARRISISSSHASLSARTGVSGRQHFACIAPNATNPAASRLIFGHDFRISDAPAAAAVVVAAAADWVQPLIHKSVQPSGGSINPSINAATVLGALCNSSVILRALRFHAVPKIFLSDVYVG